MGILKWAFPVAILYSLCAAVDTSPEDSAFEEYFQQKLNKFKLRLHEGFERARLQRHKRTVGGYESPDDNGERGFGFVCWVASIRSPQFLLLRGKYHAVFAQDGSLWFRTCVSL